MREKQVTEKPTLDDLPRLLTVEEISNLLGLSPSTVRARTGKKAKRPFPIPAIRIDGKSIRFMAEDVKAYIAKLRKEVDTDGN